MLWLLFPLSAGDQTPGLTQKLLLPATTSVRSNLRQIHTGWGSPGQQGPCFHFLCKQKVSIPLPSNRTPILQFQTLKEKNKQRQCEHGGKCPKQQVEAGPQGLVRGHLSTLCGENHWLAPPPHTHTLWPTGQLKLLNVLVISPIFF